MQQLDDMVYAFGIFILGIALFAILMGEIVYRKFKKVRTYFISAIFMFVVGSGVIVGLKVAGAGMGWLFLIVISDALILLSVIYSTYYLTKIG